jgi:hypothetical protein
LTPWGFAAGEDVGVRVGRGVGVAEGATVGRGVASVGAGVADWVGSGDRAGRATIGLDVAKGGCAIGAGDRAGAMEVDGTGSTEGSSLGSTDGAVLGSADGSVVAATDSDGRGLVDGSSVGSEEPPADGTGVGADPPPAPALADGAVDVRGVVDAWAAPVAGGFGVTRSAVVGPAGFVPGTYPLPNAPIDRPPSTRTRLSRPRAATSRAR